MWLLFTYDKESRILLFACKKNWLALAVVGCWWRSSVCSVFCVICELSIHRPVQEREG